MLLGMLWVLAHRLIDSPLASAPPVFGGAATSVAARPKEVFPATARMPLLEGALRVESAL